MPVPIGLNHLAMSVPSGTLTDDCRAELLDFYGDVLAWHEIESLRLPDRMTFSVGNHTYVNIRERDEPMTCSGYEHFGIVVASTDDAEALWDRLAHDERDVNVEPLQRGEDGYRSFRFRYVLPFAIEVQFFP
jgi:hypothetical protein